MCVHTAAQIVHTSNSPQTRHNSPADRCELGFSGYVSWGRTRQIRWIVICVRKTFIHSITGIVFFVLTLLTRSITLMRSLSEAKGVLETRSFWSPTSPFRRSKWLFQTGKPISESRMVVSNLKKLLPNVQNGISVLCYVFGAVG